ncbi:MAG: endosialidase [Eubacterium sp.]|nr:endosialidase [Eubacterium sp.]
MAVISELIREEENGSLSFGDYSLPVKTKQDGFKYNGDAYKIKTFCEITRLEKNGSFLYESVPGTAVHNYMSNASKVMFEVEGDKDAQITLELESETEYKVHVDQVYVGKMKTDLGGKLTISAELEENDKIAVVVEKVD